MVEDVSLLPVDKNSLFMDESALVKDKFAPPSFTYVPAVKSTKLKVSKDRNWDVNLHAEMIIATITRNVFDIRKKYYIFTNWSRTNLKLKI